MARVIPEPSREMNLRAARAALAEAARFGVTTIQDNSSVDALPTYQELRARGELTARMYVWRYASAMPALSQAGIRHRPRRRVDPPRRAEDPLRRLDGLGHGGLLRALRRRPEDERAPPPPGAGAGAPDRGGGRGRLPARRPRHRRPREQPRARRLREGGPGQRPARPPLPHRARAGRAQAGPAALQGAGRDRLHPAVALHRRHALGGEAHRPRAGPRRLQLPLVHRRGIPVAFGTDWFVEPLDPRLGLYAAVTRELPAGGPPGGWFPEEKITLEDALDLYTRGSAYAEFAERRRGRSRPGRLADVAVFARDLFTVAPREILDTPVDLTIVGGRIVFQRTAGAP